MDTFPDNADMHFHLANSHGIRVGFHQTLFIKYLLIYLVGQGEFAEGERFYKSAIKIAAMPKAVFHSNLGVLYHRFVVTNSKQCQAIGFY